MNEIYWITKLDLISGWLIGFAVITGFVVLVSIIAYISNRSDYETYGHNVDKRWQEFFSKIFKISLLVFSIRRIIHSYPYNKRSNDDLRSWNYN